MTTVFEAFARSVSNSMGAYLRARFEMALASVEQMPVRDFLGDFQETGSVAGAEGVSILLSSLDP
jgi:flagellar motor switch protein FliM